MGWRKNDIIGKRFGRLVVSGYVEKNGIVSRSGHSSLMKCVCDCGNEKVVKRNNLVSGQTKSCGCLAIETIKKTNTKHGKSESSLYHIWQGIKARCERKTDHAYKHYGGRGINICVEWQDFNNFNEWALENGYAEGLTIDRIDNDRGYEPSNCRWVTMQTQANNRRNNTFLTAFGKTMTISEWSRLTGINKSTIAKRKSRGLTDEECLLPVKKEEGQQ